MLNGFHLNICGVVWVYVLHGMKSGDGGLSASIFFLYEHRMGLLFVLSWARVRRVVLRSVVSL